MVASRGGRLRYGSGDGLAGGCRHLNDGAEGGIDIDGLALWREYLAEGALERGGKLGRHLLRLDLAERLIKGDGVAGLLHPLENGALGHALAQLGHGHGGHQ